MKINLIIYNALLLGSLVLSAAAQAETFAPVEIEIHTKRAVVDQAKSLESLNNIREVTLARAIWRDDHAGDKLLAVKGVNDKYSTKLKIDPQFAEMNALISLLASGEIKSMVATRNCLNCEIKIVSVRTREGKECKLNEEHPGLFDCALQNLFASEINRSPTLKQSIDAFRRPSVASTDDFRQVLKMQKNFYAELALIARRKSAPPRQGEAAMAGATHTPMR